MATGGGWRRQRAASIASDGGQPAAGRGSRPLAVRDRQRQGWWPRKNLAPQLLEICHRAKQTLDRTKSKKPDSRRDSDGKLMTARDYVELTSIEEYRKFRNMTPITKNELETIDFDELSRRLGDV